MLSSSCYSVSLWFWYPRIKITLSEIHDKIVFAQLSPLILEGLWENATELFSSWHFAVCVTAQAKELSETEGRVSESVCVHECVYFHLKRLRPKGNSSKLLLSRINNEA